MCDGVSTFEGSRRYLHAVRDAELRRAVVSASKNCRDVLVAARIDDLFEEVIDGVVAEREQLKGSRHRIRSSPPRAPSQCRADEAAVFEDASAGIAAGRAGRFGLVVGVNRSGQREALRAHGADVVVSDLVELLEQR